MHSVNFNANNDSKNNYQMIENNNIITNPIIDLTKSGYIFDGWYIDNTFESKWDFNTPVTEDLNLYAKWIAEEQTLAFDSNGGNKVMTPLIVKTDEQIILPKNKFTKDDYIFAGWADSKEGNVSFDDENTFKMGTIDKTLYAKWITKPITSSQLKAMISNGKDVTQVYTSQITDMSRLFEGEENINGDISTWDVSNVKNMTNMFFLTKVFNQDLSAWNVSKVESHEGFSMESSLEEKYKPKWND